MTLAELRGRHRAHPLPVDELLELAPHELRVLAIDEALYGTDRTGDPLPPALAAAAKAAR